jgi:hypothetical protein
MKRSLWVLTAAVFLSAGGSSAIAQGVEIDGGPPESLASSQNETDRAVILDLMSRDEIRNAARIVGIELEETVDGVLALEGENLRRAADQARRIHRDLDDKVTLSISTIVILLLLLLVIVIAA